MQQAAARRGRKSEAEPWAVALPLYAGSLVVTLAGVGAVGVTLPYSSWSVVWVALAITGHVVSLIIRRLRVPPEAVFFPVVFLGSAVALNLSFSGSPLVGLDSGLGGVPADMATAMAVAMLAVIRTFTLV